MLGRLLVVCVLGVLVTSEDDVRTTYTIYETAENIIADGYPVETHHVTTSDGYILEMHRIPHGRSVENTSENRTVVFLMHGLLSASHSFILLGADYSLAYNLADTGYDVWMGNARGNKNSRYHVSLDPDDEQEKFQFFDFTFEEIGRYDLPAMIDYALEYTGQEQLHYIGHSQGGTVFLVLTSLLPEYNAKISQAHLLAGVGYQEYFPNEEILEYAAMTDIIYNLALQNGIVELYPPNSTEMIPGDLLPFPQRTSDYCTGDPQLRHMCELFGIRYLVRDDTPLEESTLEEIQPGAALKQIAHYGQNIRDKQFRRYSYGIFQNLFTYGSFQPPSYNLGLISTYVTMHYTLNDNLLDERDVLAMVADMPRAVARQVGRTSFLHEDFVIALDAKELVTDYIIAALNNEFQEDHYTVNDEVIVVDGETSTDGQVTVIDGQATVTDAPVTVDVTDANIDATEPTTDSANNLSIPLNMCLILISFYMILK